MFEYCHVEQNKVKSKHLMKKHIKYIANRSNWRSDNPKNIINSEAKMKIKTNPLGAELTSVIYNNEERIHNGEAFWKRHAPILFPIVGQIKNNETFINDKKYSMTQHGFARDMMFDVKKKTETECVYVLRSNEETLKKFPFEFELYVNYTVIENKLKVEYEVINKDNKIMYFGIGGHPAFVANIQDGTYYLEFEKEENNIEYKKLDEGLISNRKIEKINNGKIINLDVSIFNEDAIIMKNIESNKVKLKTKNTCLLEFDFTDFPYLAIWSKPGANFICIEPWFNTADTVDSDGIFENKENILKLLPGKNFKCEYSVKFY